MDSRAIRSPVAGALCAGLAALALACAQPAHAQYAEGAGDQMTPEQQAWADEISKLKWVEGPTVVDTEGNAKLAVPEGYVFLDKKDTRKFLELNENLSDGSEVMIAPKDLSWSAYLDFLDEGYVKDDEKIDADALLKQLKEGTEQANEERKRRGWGELHVVGWAVRPNYNSETKRLEWATELQSDGGTGTNFFTKILGRKGHTSVQMVASSEDLTNAVDALNGVLAGYEFKQGNRYADFKPGDKVAEYGLAAMIVGGAAAVATKKGLWPAIGAFLAASWKVVAAAGVAAVAGLKRVFGKKDA